MGLVKSNPMNLKRFIEDSFIALNCNNITDLEELECIFASFYETKPQDKKLRYLTYIYSNKLVADNSLLRRYFHRLCMT